MNSIDAEFVTSAVRRSGYPAGTLPEVAFAGRSNVGKSSVINTVLGRKRLARTSGTPGRTQQINFFLVRRAAHFVDLPGYGFARVPRAVKEQWGPMVEEYLQTRQNLKLVVVILDIRRDTSPEDRTLIDWLVHYGIPHRFVLTKADKLSKSAAAARRRDLAKPLQVPADELILFSARTGQGRSELLAAFSDIVPFPRNPGETP
ncbi:MAG: GTP-binding protein [delta proteobacterium MLS_D]|jgi:GTP-binding protein|nr:MAG: GTP-binding protein [delta proteobacterium MLS_D]